MPAPQVVALREYVESVQARYTDPSERERALEQVDTELRDLLGTVEGYRGDARMQQEAAERAEEEGDGEG